MGFSFGKKEKLVSTKRIDELFKNGKVVKAYPLLCKYNFESEESALKVAFSVPKRKVKSAVKRNRIKRQLREAYRLNNATIKEKVKKKEKNLALFLIYSGGEKSTFKEIQEKLVLILCELENRI